LRSASPSVGKSRRTVAAFILSAAVSAALLDIRNIMAPLADTAIAPLGLPMTAQACSERPCSRKAV
jgi:hypothetical protein